VHVSLDSSPTHQWVTTCHPHLGVCLHQHEAPAPAVCRNIQHFLLLESIPVQAQESVVVLRRWVSSLVHSTIRRSHPGKASINVMTSITTGLTGWTSAAVPSKHLLPAAGNHKLSSIQIAQHALLCTNVCCFFMLGTLLRLPAPATRVTGVGGGGGGMQAFNLYVLSHIYS
jgi:hypothetical protein